MEEISITEYIKDHYGYCRVYNPDVKDSCRCMKEGFPPGCPNWVPVKEDSFNEMIERLKNENKEVKK